MKGLMFAVCIASGLAALGAKQNVRYIENDSVKVGVDLNAGGAVMYVEDKLRRTGNMINHHDHGRQIQQSYYSGPVPYIGPKGEKPHPSWANLGWNPIQTGDVGGNPSPVVSFKSSPTSMVIRTIPMLWPHRGVRAECEFVTEITLVKSGFRYRATIKNNRSDTADYGRKSQEVPALYTNARWYKSVAYLGDRPWTDAPVAMIVAKGDGKGWPWRRFTTPESWCALVGDDGAGIGVYNAEALHFLAGFAGGDDNKGHALGPSDNPTGYIAPIRYNVLDHNATLSYEALFALGSVEDIRRVFAKEARRKTTTSSWEFRRERLSWTHVNAVSTGYPLHGAYEIVLKNGAELVSPQVFARADCVRSVRIVASAQASAKKGGAPGALKCTLVLDRFSPSDLIDYPAWNEKDQTVADYRKKMSGKYPELKPVSIGFEIPLDGKPHVVEIPVSESGAGAYKRYHIAFRNVDGQTFSLFSFSVR